MTGEVPQQRLEELERGLDPALPLPPKLGVRIIGYGEISTVLLADDLPNVVLKRMAGFHSKQEVQAYQAEVETYLQALADRNVQVAKTHVQPVCVEGRNLAYLVQERLAAESIGNQVLLHSSDDEFATFLSAILDTVSSVLNNPRPDFPLGIDAQISNWARRKTPEGIVQAIYLDVGTPIFRQHGTLAHAPALALRSLPRPLAFLLRHLLFEKVVGRYFDPREVVKDIAANFLKEGRPDRVATLLQQSHSMLSQLSPQAKPLSEKEVRSYYFEDKQIWSLFQALRRLDRALTTKLLRRRYEYILPGNMKR